MGLYSDVIQLIDLAEEQLCISDLNVDDISASLKGAIEHDQQKAQPVPSCPANNVIMRLEALVDHCTSIANKTCEINEALNGQRRDHESVARIRKEELETRLSGALSAQKIKQDLMPAR